MAATTHVAFGEPRFWREPQIEPAAERARIFDIPIDLGRPPELMRRITGWVGNGGPARRVMYVNAHVLNQSREIPSLRAALEQADLVYCDGYGVRLAAKALDVEIPAGFRGWLAAGCAMEAKVGIEPAYAALQAAA